MKRADITQVNGVAVVAIVAIVATVAIVTIVDSLAIVATVAIVTNIPQVDGGRGDAYAVGFSSVAYNAETGATNLDMFSPYAGQDPPHI